MSTDFVQIDAFTSTAFGGNPAAVCVLDAEADPTWMQQVATEMNLSETAFLHPNGDGWNLRWFTPAVEVDLCGHATLASAHALVHEHGVNDRVLKFHTRSGLLTATVGATDAITLDFPSDPPSPCDPPEGLLEALGATPAAVAQGATDYLVQLASDAAVRGLEPDITALGRLDARGIIITARNDRAGFDIVSRFFAPAAGVAEDPVTGSAHTTLAPWWAERLGSTMIRAEQASRRGGTIDIELVDRRVRLTGQAVTVARGQLLV